MHTHDKSWKHINRSPEQFFDPFLCVFLFSGLNTHFQLIFSRFYLFLSVFTYSQSILPIFDCFYLFSTIFTQIWALPLIWLIFISFSIVSFISCYIWLFFITLTHISSPSTIATHFQPLLLIFNHFRGFYLFLKVLIDFID